MNNWETIATFYGKKIQVLQTQLSGVRNERKMVIIGTCTIRG
jgi:hypothetical protein